MATVVTHSNTSAVDSTMNEANDETNHSTPTVEDLNLQGINLLKHGSFSEAVSTFSQGLQLLMSQQGQNEKERTDSSAGTTPKRMRLSDAVSKKVEDHSQENATGPKQVQDKERLLYSISLRDEEQSFDKSDAYVLFQRALQVSLKIQETKDEDEEAKHLLWTGVLLYNLALAHHMHGLQVGQLQRLKMALKLYSVAQTCFLSEHVLGILALRNNKGHIEAQFARVDRAEAESGAMAEWLLRVDNEDIYREEYYIFFFNACFYKMVALVSAPAA